MNTMTCRMPCGLPAFRLGSEPDRVCLLQARLGNGTLTVVRCQVRLG